jgi:hypothetical protein
MLAGADQPQRGAGRDVFGRRVDRSPVELERGVDLGLRPGGVVQVLASSLGYEQDLGVCDHAVSLVAPADESALDTQRRIEGADSVASELGVARQLVRRIELHTLRELAAGCCTFAPAA